jgi:hypothetical protein
MDSSDMYASHSGAAEVNRHAVGLLMVQRHL